MPSHSFRVFTAHCQYGFLCVGRCGLQESAEPHAIPDAGYSRFQVRTPPHPPPLYVPERLVLRKDTHQAHVMIGARGYDAYDDKRTALYLLNNMLAAPA